MIKSDVDQSCLVFDLWFTYLVASLLHVTSPWIRSSVLWLVTAVLNILMDIYKKIDFKKKLGTLFNHLSTDCIK